MIKFWRGKSNYLELEEIKTHIQTQAAIFNPLLSRQVTHVISKTQLMLNLKKITNRQYSKAYLRLDNKIQTTQIKIWIRSTKRSMAQQWVLPVVKSRVLKSLKQHTLERTKDAWWLDLPLRVEPNSRMNPILHQLIQETDHIQDQQVDLLYVNLKWTHLQLLILVGFLL